MEDTGRPAPRRGRLAAFWLTLAGMFVGVVAEFADLPGWLGLAGAAAFVVGTAIAVRSAFSSTRRDGTSVFRSLARSVKLGFRWLWAFMP